MRVRKRLTFVNTPVMSLSDNKLSQLPNSLQSQILSSLASSPRCNITPSLQTVSTQREKLPKDLLSVAKSSRALSEATADTLGARAQILNKTTAHPLPEWIAALGKAVKAVSLYEYDFERMVNLTGLSFKSQEFFDELCEDALATFNVLAKDEIALHVLDVKILPFPKCNNPDVLTEALTNALRRSSQSLRELGLRLTPICVNAVSRVTLPKLKVAELKLNEIEGVDHLSKAGKEKTAAAFMQMFCALEGHADREANKNTLSELRLINLVDAPCVDAKDACIGLFEAIQTLNVQITRYQNHDDTAVAKFFTLFPNLRSLHWNGTPTTEHLRMIHISCLKLEEISLCPHVRYTFTLDPSPYAQQGDASKLSEVFVACQGKLHSLDIKAELTTDQMKVLGENSPALQRLSMEIGPGNIGGLSLLLGTHCRQLKALNLTLSEHAQHCPGEDGWREFAESIRSASDELCELSIENDDDRDPLERAQEAMLQSILDILEILGERAHRLSFLVPMETISYRVLFEGYCKVIDACMTHSKNLEEISVCFQAGDVDLEFETLEEQTFWCEKLVRDMKKLREIPGLKKLDFGGMDTLAAELLEEEY